jgi:hypothetical protein
VTTHVPTGQQDCPAGRGQRVEERSTMPLVAKSDSALISKVWHSSGSTLFVVPNLTTGRMRLRTADAIGFPSSDLSE